MNYKNYKKSRDLAWQVLLQENITELPLNIVRLCHRMNIRVQYYDPTDENDGCCTILFGKPRIFVSRNCSPERQRFTIAHELGHILLGHVGKYELVNREPCKNESSLEHAANVFAIRLLAPACVLWALNVSTPEEISTLCRISYQAAVFRAQRMRLLSDRNKFLTSPLELRVYQQFAEFIKNEKERYSSSGTSDI